MRLDLKLVPVGGLLASLGAFSRFTLIFYSLCSCNTIFYLQILIQIWNFGPQSSFDHPKTLTPKINNPQILVTQIFCLLPKNCWPWKALTIAIFTPKNEWAPKLYDLKNSLIPQDLLCLKMFTLNKLLNHQSWWSNQLCGPKNLVTPRNWCILIFILKTLFIKQSFIE